MTSEAYFNVTLYYKRHLARLKDSLPESVSRQKFVVLLHTKRRVSNSKEGKRQ